MGKFGMFVKFTVKDGARDLFVQHLLEAAESMRQLEGCECYLVNVSPEDHLSVYVYEVWKDEEAHQASLSLESARALIERSKPLITKVDKVAALIPIGGKGLS